MQTNTLLGKKRKVIADYCMGVPLNEMVSNYNVEYEKIVDLISSHPASISIGRCREAVRARREGKSLKEIGDGMGVTRERVRQILQKYAPSIFDEVTGPSLLVQQSLQKKQEEFEEKWGRKQYHFLENDLGRRMALAFNRKKQNAKKHKWEWTVKRQDIDFPLVCPILGMELDWFAETRQENSPSFDRLDSTKGYVKGNVIICSWRANRIKNDGNSKEHELIASFLKKHNL